MITLESPITTTFTVSPHLLPHLLFKALPLRQNGRPRCPQPAPEGKGREGSMPPKFPVHTMTSEPVLATIAKEAKAA